MPPKIVPRPNLAELHAIAFGDEPEPRLLRKVPTIQEIERRRFRLAKVQMDAVIEAFRSGSPAPTTTIPVQRTVTPPILERCAGAVDNGRPCRRDVHVVAGTIPLCVRHLETLVEILTGALEQLPAEPEPARTMPSPAVVYYMGDPPTQTIKIGTTTQIRDRWYALSARKPELLLLAIEPGTYDVERERHRTFRHLRIPGTKEWFRKVPQLMDHVNAVRANHGMFLSGRDFVPSWGVAKLKPLVAAAQESAQ